MPASSLVVLQFGFVFLKTTAATHKTGYCHQAVAIFMIVNQSFFTHQSNPGIEERTLKPRSEIMALEDLSNILETEGDPIEDSSRY